jgi:hypothetical protein
MPGPLAASTAIATSAAAALAAPTRASRPARRDPRHGGADGSGGRARRPAARAGRARPAARGRRGRRSPSSRSRRFRARPQAAGGSRRSRRWPGPGRLRPGAPHPRHTTPATLAPRVGVREVCLHPPPPPGAQGRLPDWPLAAAEQGLGLLAHLGLERLEDAQALGGPFPLPALPPGRAPDARAASIRRVHRYRAGGAARRGRGDPRSASSPRALRPAGGGRSGAQNEPVRRASRPSSGGVSQGLRLVGGALGARSRDRMARVHVVVETDRLILRRFTEDDVDLLADLDADPRSCGRSPAVGRRRGKRSSARSSRRSSATTSAPTATGSWPLTSG